MSAARFFPYAASLLLDFAYAIIAVCALSRNTWASPLRTLACLLLCVLLVASTWWHPALMRDRSRRICALRHRLPGSLIVGGRLGRSDSHGGRVRRCGPRLGAARPAGFPRARQPS